MMNKDAMNAGCKPVSTSSAPGLWAVVSVGVWLGLSVGVLGCSSEGQGSAAPVVLTAEQQQEYARRVEVGRQLINANQPEQSLPVLSSSLEINPDGFAAHNNLCVAYGMLQQRDRAIASCQRALELTPEDQLAKNNLAWVSGLPATPAAH